MPAKLERMLRADAKRRGYEGERADRYVYGTLAKVKKAKEGEPK